MNVPQGSVECPCLFDMYLNNICLAIEHTEVSYFSDDTTCYSSHWNLNEAATNVVHDCEVLVSGHKEEVVCKSWQYTNMGRVGSKIFRYYYSFNFQCKKSHNI